MEKHSGGRPLKFGSPEELQARIDQYFSSCEGQLLTKKEADGREVPVLDKHDKPVIVGEKPQTITGLAHALGMTRRGFLNYRYRPAFSRVVARARMRVETYTEERLFDRDGFSGARFLLLTCFAWGEPAADNVEPPKPVIIVQQKPRGGPHVKG